MSHILKVQVKQLSPRSAVDAVGVCIVRLSVNRPVVEQLLRPRRLSWSSPFHQQQGSSFAHIPVAATLVDPVEVAPGPSSSAPSAPSVSVRDLVPCFAPAVPYLSRLKHPIGQIFLAWHFSDPSLAAGHLVFCIASPALPYRTVPTTRPLQLDSFYLLCRPSCEFIAQKKTVAALLLRLRLSNSLVLFRPETAARLEPN